MFSSANIIQGPIIQTENWFRCPCSPKQMTQRKKAPALLNLTLTAKKKGFSLSHMVTLSCTTMHGQGMRCVRNIFWTFQFSIFIISQKKKREKKNVICSSVAAYITCAIELILMGVLVDTVEQMSNSRVTIFLILYCGYSRACTRPL